MPSNTFIRALPCLLCAFLAIVLLAGPPSAAAADLKAAERAMRTGDYEAAIREAEPLAEQGNDDARQLVGIAKVMLEAKRQKEERLAIAKATAERFAEGKRAYDRADYQVALREWVPAAEAGSRDAQFWLGELYTQGEGVEQNFETANSFYLRAALQGHSRAQYKAGEYMLRADGIGQDQKALAFNLLLRAATSGETHAYMSLSWAYCGGIGTEKNILLADLWMTLALDHPEDYGLLQGMQCDYFTPVTEGYRRDLLKRADALRYAYGLKPAYPR